MRGGMAESSVYYSEESYFSFLYSSSRQTILANRSKYFFNLLFVLALASKLSGRNLTWYEVFSPAFLSNAVSIILCFQEVDFFLASSEPRYRLLRHGATVVDLLGSLYCKVIICYCLNSTWTAETSWTTMLIPFWCCTIISACLRCFHSPPRSMPTPLSSRHRVATVISGLFYLIHRGLQPFLIALRIDEVIESHWSIVFAPSWSMIFLGLACALLLVSFAPFVHVNSHSDLRSSARSLVYLLSLQLAFTSSNCLVFLVLLTQRLDNVFDRTLGHDHDIWKVAAPLLLLFTGLLVLSPMMSYMSSKFQHYSASVVLQRLSRPSPHAPLTTTSNPLANQTRDLCRTNKITWLRQTSHNVYEVIDTKSLNLSKDKEKEREQEHNVNGQDSPFMPRPSGDDIEMGSITTSKDAASIVDFEQQDVCIVCLVRPIDSVFLHCGHAVCCLHCALTMGKKESSAHCPLCRGNLEAVLYLNSPPMPLDSSNQDSGQAMVAVSSRQYSFQASSTINSTINHGGAGYQQEAVMQPGEMNNASAIGNTVNVQAASNTIAYHDSLFDVIF